MLEAVVNVSEGRDAGLLAELAAAAGRSLLDVHRDPDHHRSVFTLAGPDAEVESGARALATAVVATVDLTRHAGVHPRLGSLDVVPFVALDVERGELADGDPALALAARRRFTDFAADALRLPCFAYGPRHEPSLPELRRRAWRDLAPVAGPDRPHPTAGAVCVGARPVLVAYNLWLTRPDLDAARVVAADLRSPAVRTLALRVGADVQVSCNLVDPWRVGPAAIHDAVAARLPVARSELVGLVPAGVVAAVPPDRRDALDCRPRDTLEARLRQAGLDGGRFPIAGR